ncbi:hypothetical protein KEM52_001059, partial [Ascosphaera acerosa]
HLISHPHTDTHIHTHIMADESPADNAAAPVAPAPTEHLNIKVTDNNNEVFFKIKRTTQLRKLMDAFCERQGKDVRSVRFLFDGTRVRAEDTPNVVCKTPPSPSPARAAKSRRLFARCAFTAANHVLLLLLRARSWICRMAIH